MFVHKCIHHVLELPGIFNNYFVPNSHKTRQGNQLRLLISNTEYGQRCLNYKSCNLWNKLPKTLQENAKTHQLRRKLKSI